MPPREPNGKSSESRSVCQRYVCSFELPLTAVYRSNAGGIVGSPTAIRAILAAAFRYRSSRAGAINKASAFVSKPWACWSGGSNADASTSTPVSSRTALAYSVRFNRWRFAVRPGFRWAAAALSSSDSSHVATLSYVALSGRRLPAGGMDRLRSFTMTFSQVSAELNAFSVSAFSSVRPPVFSRSLWQVMQYAVTRSATGVAEKENGEEHRRHKNH